MGRPLGGFTYIHKGLENRIFDDLYHWLLRISWPKFLGFLAATYTSANLLFTFLYLAGGDCINAPNPGSFLEAFSFSVQTMSTIGYGGMKPTTAYAHIIITLEAFVGLLMVAMMSGLMFAKFSRPRARIKFSDSMVINNRDGLPTLQVRMSNLRDSKILEAQARLYVIKTVLTNEGNTLRRPFDLRLEREQTPLFPLSWLLVHPLTPESPLYEWYKGECSADFQIILSCSGIEENLLTTVFAQYTYRVEDIVRNAEFEDMIHKTGPQKLEIDHSLINQVKPLKSS